MFKVSVIIPVFNAGKYVFKAVESALEQDEVAEIILIEDGSSDNGLAICQSIVQDNKKVKLFQHPDRGNHGAGASRNLGIQNAQCRYVAFLDADDQYLPGRFEVDKRIFLSDPDVEGVYNACVEVALDEKGHERLGDGFRELLTMKSNFQPEELFENISPIGSGGFFFLNTLTIKIEVFQKTGLLDASLRLSQDTDIAIKLAALCRLVPGNLTQPVSLYGIHSGNRSYDPDQLNANRPVLFYKLYEWSRKNNLSKTRLFILWQNFYQFNIWINKISRRQQLVLLLKEACKNPQLLTSRYFLKQMPLIRKVIA